MVTRGGIAVVTLVFAAATAAMATVSPAQTADSTAAETSVTVMSEFQDRGANRGSQRRYGVRSISKSPAPVSVFVRRAGADTPLTTLTPGPPDSFGNRTAERIPAGLPTGRFQLCFTQPAAESWAADEGCTDQDIPANYNVSIAAPKTRGGQVSFVMRAHGHAVGQRFRMLRQALAREGDRLKWQRAGASKWYEPGILRSTQTITVPASKLKGRNRRNRLIVLIPASVDARGTRWRAAKLERAHGEPFRFQNVACGGLLASAMGCPLRPGTDCRRVGGTGPHCVLLDHN